MANQEHEIKVKVTGKDEASPTLKAALDRLAESTDRLMQVQLAQANAAANQKNKHEELNGGLLNLTAAFTLVKEGAEIVMHAFHAVEAQLEHAIEEALEFEKANNRLAGALVATGQYTLETVDAIEAYVEGTEDGVKGLEQLVGANGELVKNLIATGVQMGLSVDKAKQMEEAARKLAVATGKDTKEAFDMLAGSLTGQSRGLARVLPQIKEFGEAQLKQGVGIDLVNQALNKQYELYQKSLPASIDRAKVSIDNVYKAFGLMITQSDLSKKAVDLFTATMEKLEHGIKALDHWLTENKQSIYDFGAAFLKTVQIVGSGIAVYAAASIAFATYAGFISIATIASTAFAAVMAVITSPITLTIAAVALLTAAFYKWPGLFDVVTGSIKALLAVALLPLTATIGGITVAIGATAKALGGEWGAAVQKAGEDLIKWNVQMAKNGAEQAKLGAQSIATGKQVQKAHDGNAEAAKKELQAQSDLNKKLLERGKLYDGFFVGTEKQREALRAQVQDRDKDLKDFTDYMNARIRLAVSKAEEERMAVNAMRGKALESAGGSTGGESKASVEIDAERKKQSELQVLRDKHILDEEEYQGALMASRQRAAEAQLAYDQANMQARADLLGESEEGFALKQQIAEERFQLELELKIQRAQLEMATDEEIAAMKTEATAIHQQQQRDQLDAHLAAIASREELSGATIAATRQQWFRKMEKAGMDHLKQLASGITMMEGLQEGYNKTTQKLGDALVKNEKITASKFVGVFLESLGRKLQMDGFAAILQGTVMSIMLNPQGPLLIAAGGAEVAGGTAIARLGTSMQGGQADEGIDSVPQPLSGKSFVVSGGERIVQPSANRDLTSFLNQQKTGGSNTNNIVMNISFASGTSNEMARETVDALIAEIRRRSELGTPIISERGITPA